MDPIANFVGQLLSLRPGAVAQLRRGLAHANGGASDFLDITAKAGIVDVNDVRLRDMRLLAQAFCINPRHKRGNKFGLMLGSCKWSQQRIRRLGSSDKARLAEHLTRAMHFLAGKNKPVDFYALADTIRGWDNRKDSFTQRDQLLMDFHKKASVDVAGPVVEVDNEEVVEEE